MMPFFDDESLEPDWRLLDIVGECIENLPEKQREILHRIFYMRETYQELAGNIGTKAKSYAWRQTRHALDCLKAELENHPEFVKIWSNKNGNMG